jgi:hypothetical protein
MIRDWLGHVSEPSVGIKFCVCVCVSVEGRFLFYQKFHDIKIVSAE